MAILARGDCRGCPPERLWNQAEYGAARLWLVLDRRRRMGEGRAVGVLDSAKKLQVRLIISIVITTLTNKKYFARS